MRVGQKHLSFLFLFMFNCVLMVIAPSSMIIYGEKGNFSFLLPLQRTLNPKKKHLTVQQWDCKKMANTRREGKRLTIQCKMSF